MKKHLWIVLLSPIMALAHAKPIVIIAVAALLGGVAALIAHAQKPASQPVIVTASAPAPSAPSAAEIARRRKELENQRKTEHKQSQARQDVDFYASQRQRLMTLYEIAENEYNNASTDKARMIAGNRLMSYDDRLRRIERQMENAYFTANN